MEKDPQGDIRFEGMHCNLVIERPVPGVVVVRVSGRDVGEFGDAPLKEMTVDLARSPLELFIDARNVQGASIDVSNDWAQWLRTHRSELRQVSMLTGSRFIQLTADFVRRFSELGDVMRIYTDAAAFDEALAEAIAVRP